MRDDGGTAFPVEGMRGLPGSSGQQVQMVISSGMSLRDYFAGEAMQGYLSGLSSSTEMTSLAAGNARDRGMTADQYIAKHSYALADAMLEARK